MKKTDTSRRRFIKQHSMAGLGGLLLGGVHRSAASLHRADASDGRSSGPGKIGNLGLEELRDRYKAALFSRFVPNMNSLVIDHEFGGFMCNADIAARKLLSTDKSVWNEGRGIWTYSFLYNNFGQNPEFLEVARKSKDFILQHQPADNSFWTASFTREGKPTSGPGDIYGNLYLAEGLTEFAKASNDSKYRAIAKRILLDALARYDRADYLFPISYGPAGASPIQAPRVLGHWMTFLRPATQFLEHGADPDIERLAERCVEAILHRHLNAQYGLLNEGLHHDFSLPPNEWSQFSYFATGIQTLWMLMSEAVRTHNTKLFQNAREAFVRHVRVAADPVYGGYFRSLDSVDQNKYKMDKVLSLQEEVLIGTLLLVEHTGDPFARNCFAQTYNYVQEKFAHPEYAFMVESGDRKLSDYSKKGAGNYHHPRHLMMNLLSLERMIKRDGKPSGMFD